MFIRHRHRSNYAIRFVSGHVFRRADTAAKKIRALAPAYGNSTPPFRSREYRCRMPHVLRDLIHCGKTQSATVPSFSGIVYRCPVSISLTTQISAARFHMLITVGHEISIERAVQFIKGGFAFRAGRELRFTPPVWERGFSEVRIYGSEALARVWEYIAQNPVKRRLVQRPAEYAYSSSNARFELDEVPQGLKPTGSASRRHV